MKKLILAICLSGFALEVFGIPTKLIVRAKAKDAKFIGSSIGGAKIIIRDALTGKILSEGITQGSTGDTQVIMREAHERYKPLTDQNTAKFEATLDIQKPLFITVEAIAPVNQKQASISASTQLWLIPGKDIDGDGLILEIPGFIVNILSPQTHESIASEKGSIRIVANVVMMCGCTISSDGLWDSDKMEVEASIVKSGEVLQVIPMKIEGKVNTFEGNFKPEEAGLYEVIVSAYQKDTGNTGLDKLNIIVK